MRDQAQTCWLLQPRPKQTPFGADTTFARGMLEDLGLAKLVAEREDAQRFSSVDGQRRLAAEVNRMVAAAVAAGARDAPHGSQLQWVALEAGEGPASHPCISLDAPPPGKPAAKPKTLWSQPAAAAAVADRLAALLVTKTLPSLTVVTIAGSGGSPRSFTRRTVRQPEPDSKWICD